MSDTKGFFLIEDEPTRLRLIREAAKSLAPATLWTAGKSLVVKTRISRFDIAAGIFETSLPEDFSLERALKIVSSREGVFFNVELPSTHLLFQTKFHHYESAAQRLEFRIPEEVYKIQQRKHPRLITRQSSSIRAYHEDPLQAGRMIRRTVLDLSVGGLSMRLFFGEERHYRIGHRFESLQLQIGQRIINCRAEIRNIRVAQLGHDQSELVMGTEFLNLDEPTRKILNDYVSRELVKQFGRMIAKQKGEQDKSDDDGKGSGG